LLEEILPRNTVFEDFEVERIFPGVGHKSLLLNARRLAGESGDPSMILLAFEEVLGRHKPGNKSQSGRRNPVL